MGAGWCPGLRHLSRGRKHQAVPLWLCSVGWKQKCLLIKTKPLPNSRALENSTRSSSPRDRAAFKPLPPAPGGLFQEQCTLYPTYVSPPEGY